VDPETLNFGQWGTVIPGRRRGDVAPREKRMAAVSPHDRACRAIFGDRLQGLARSEIWWKNWKPIHGFASCERRLNAVNWP
jgi:hypothetical protein